MENLHDSTPKTHPPEEYYLMGFGETDLVDRKRWERIAVFTLLAVVMISGGIWLFSGQKEKRSPLPASVSPPVQRPKPIRLQRLPSPLSRVAPDQSYSAAHPGWERYISDVGEFLIFREGNKIKAIQLLADKGRVIPDDFVRNLFRETCGTDVATVIGKTRKGRYEATSGKVGSSADFLIYRKPGSIDIRGVVLTFSNAAGP